MASDPEFPETFDDLRQATSGQRQAIYRRIINSPDVVRELVRAMTVTEADVVIDALEAAAERLHARTAPTPVDQAPLASEKLTAA